MKLNAPFTLVVTSIQAPAGALLDLAQGSRENEVSFIVVGDAKSPPDFSLPGCRFFSLADQRELGFATSTQCPTGHYARKNIGYLIALREGASVLVETDDDNFPRASFWAPRQRLCSAPIVAADGWLNAYRYFTDEFIWPRGLPLDAVKREVPPLGVCKRTQADCPIQQGLADSNPDVDAIYRMVMPLPVEFSAGEPIALSNGTWCPFNSQNTTWWRDAAPLMYLPAFCSFRMTDIWRSFVAQRIAWENNWKVMFHGPTVRQDRNEHDLMRDFRDEIPGYVNNSRICELLSGVSLKTGSHNLGDNLQVCYEQLVRHEMLDARELPLLGAWLEDMAEVL